MRRILNRLSNLLLLCLSLSGLALLMLDTLGVNSEEGLLVWILGLCLLIWLSVSFRLGLIWGSPLVLGLLFLAYRHFYHGDFTMLDAAFDQLGSVWGSGAAVSGSVAGSFQLIVLAFTAVLGFYLSAALTMRRFRILLSELAVLPILAGCLTINSAPPSLPVAAILLFLLLLYVSGGSYREQSRIGRSTLLCLIPCLLLIGGLLWTNSPEGYHFTQQEAAFSQRVDELLRQISRYISGDTSAMQGEGQRAGRHASESPEAKAAPAFRSSWQNQERSMDLTQPYDSLSARTQVFRLRAEQNGRLYVRLMSYGEYTGTGWTAPLEGPLGSLNFASRAARESGASVEHQADLQMEASLDAQLMPYYCVSPSGSDSYVEPGPENYSVLYLSCSGLDSLQVPQELREAEALYRDFAYDYYTRLPQSTRQAMLDYAQAAGLAADNPNIISRVANHIQQNGHYNLAVQPYPSDDYALYFLEESSEGYCIHFATAAAALYRALDIPARVVEGFLVDARAGRYVSVTGDSAHAWVEVYRDGLGWLPVEVTGMSAADWEPSGPGENDTPPDPTPSLDPEHAEEDAEPAPAGAEESNDFQIPVGPIDSTGTGLMIRHWLLRLLWVLLGLAALAAALALHYLLRRTVFGLKTMQNRHREAVVACWKYGEKAARFGAELPRELQELAEKAAFSPHQITKAEARKARGLLLESINGIYPQLKALKKLVFRFILGLK